MTESLLSSLTASLGDEFDAFVALPGGGMSSVFRARDRRLDREVVIKVLPPLLLTPESIERFRREIAVLAALQHPQIVPILTAREVGPLPAFVMPLVHGESLRSRLDRGPLSIRESVAILGDVLRALDHAHRHGVTHRDIKPDNVLLTAHSAVVTDFGIAKVRATVRSGPRAAANIGAAEANVITREGVSLGTASYMAPEQIAGDPSADHRVDLYAWGVLAYELLAGSPPFRHEAPHKVLTAHLTEVPRAIDRARPDVPPGLAALVMQCLEKDPERRPRAAADMLRRMQEPAAIAHAPTSQTNPARGGLFDRFQRTLWQDVVVSARSLRRTPIVAVTCVVTLALAIGAGAAAFSLFDQALLRTPAIPDAERVVMIDGQSPNPGSQSCSGAGGCDVVLSLPMVRDLAAQPDGFRSIGAFVPGSFVVEVGIDADVVEGQMVTGGFFPALGVVPRHGRLIGPDDDRIMGAHPVVVVSHEFWRSRLGERDDIIGRTLSVNAQPLTIIGVAPPGFRGVTFGSNPQLYVPISQVRELAWAFLHPAAERRNLYFLYTLGRMADGLSAEQAITRLNARYQPIVQQIELPAQSFRDSTTRAAFATKTLRATPLVNSRRGTRAQAFAPLTGLIVTTVMLLLAAVANVSGLLMVRSSHRRGELALRLALGAKRGTLSRLLLVESLLLAGSGLVAGLVFALLTLRGIERLAPPWLTEIAFTLDTRSVVFAATVTLCCGVLCGLVPAIIASRPDLMQVLRSGTAQVTESRVVARMRGVLVMIQVAVAACFLVVGTLFIHSLLRVNRTETGLREARVLAINVAPGRLRMDGAQQSAMRQALLAAVAAVPGVEAVGSASTGFLTGSRSGSSIRMEGEAERSGEASSVGFDIVAPGTLTLAGVPFRAGRDLASTDGGPGQRAVVVNESFVRHFALGAGAIGRRFTMNESTYEIVGVVADTRHVDPKEEPTRTVWLSADHEDPSYSYWVYARVAGEESSVAAGVRRAMNEAAPRLPLEHVGSLEDQRRARTRDATLLGALAAGFSALGVFLAAIGLYGTLSFAVERRTREIGIRVALGASPSRVYRLVAGEATWIVGGGLVLGVTAGLSVARVVRSLLFDLTPGDPSSLLAALAVLALACMAAVALPAWRALRIAPGIALRAE